MPWEQSCSMVCVLPAIVAGGVCLALSRKKLITHAACQSLTHPRDSRCGAMEGEQRILRMMAVRRGPDRDRPQGSANV